MRYLAIWLLVLSTLAFSGCSSSDSGGGDGNRPPVADAGLDQSVITGTAVTLNGSGCSDPDGDNLSHDWSFVSKPDGSAAALSDPTAVSPTFTADLPGSYVVRLVINDGTSGNAEDTVTITVATANAPPVANAGTDQNVSTGAEVALNGGGTDADGDSLSYAWSIVSKPEGSAAALSDATAANPTFTADRDGSYVLRLIVNDGALDSTEDTVTVVAVTGNVAPVANAGPDQNVTTGIPVVLSGSGSDADGDDLNYAWAVVSQPAGSNVALSDPAIANPIFTPIIAGHYVLRLIVHDGTAASVADMMLVTAAAPALTLLNDSGQAQFSDGISFSAVQAASHPGQDAGAGRDALAAAGQLTKEGAGAAGFDFTKLDATGTPMTFEAFGWSCVQDNHTELVWEVKTSDGGAHHHQNIYTFAEAQAFAAAANAESFCGHTDWRLPSREELRSIVNYGRSMPAIDAAFFPNIETTYWTADTYARLAGRAWIVDFSFGNDNSSPLESSHFVVLVRK